jgi:hypothetical protein
MKKLLKIAVVLVLLVVVAVAVIVYLAYRNVNEIVRFSTEKGLAYALMVPATVGGAEVNFTEQWVELSDITIPNPEGYKTSHAMKFGVIRAEIDAASFRTNERRVKLVLVNNPDISFEQKLRTSNIQQLLDNVSRLAGTAENEPAPSADPATEPTLIIDKVRVENTVVRFTLPLASVVASESGNATMRVSDIEINDFGGGKQQTPAEALQLFIAVILETVIKNGQGILSAETLASLKGSMEGLPGGVSARAGEAASAVGGVATTVSDELQKALGGASEAAGTAADAVGGAVDDARRGLGRLIPGGQSEKKTEQE